MRPIARLLSFAILVFGTTTVGAAVPGDALYTRSGELLSSRTARLNFYCTGSGSPTVVFDAGFGDWSPSWAAVQPRIARWTRPYEKGSPADAGLPYFEPLRLRTLLVDSDPQV